MEHEAGRELDARIATQIFGYTLDYEFADTMDGPCVPALRDQYDEWGMLPHYSTDIGDAWLVVERMRDMWTEATAGASGLADDFPHPFDDAHFFDILRRNANRRWPWAFFYVTPAAICRAALAAREGEQVVE